MTLDFQRDPQPGLSEAATDPEAAWVRVVIVNYNSGGMLQRALGCLADQTMRAFEAVIVDNASSDRSIAELRLPDARFRVVQLSENRGFAEANNVGARGTSARWIATLNPDAFARPDWLEQLRAATERHPGVEMFASVQIKANDESRLDGCGDVMSIYGIPWRGGFGQDIGSAPTIDFETFGPCAAAALYNHDVFEAVGGFDERFFCYLEDVDLAFRIRLRGGRCVVARFALVSHVGSAITGRESDFTVFHSYRNRIWLVVKNMPVPLLFIALPLHFLVTLILIWKLFIRGRARPAVRGFLAGAAALRTILASRKRIQSRRTVSVAAFAGVLVWNPVSIRKVGIYVLQSREPKALRGTHLGTRL